MTKGEDERFFWTRVTDYLGGRNLNENQRKAVTAEGDAVIIEAGPGSGKTTVLTLRVAYLLQVLRIPAHKICVVTFTTAAAAELRTRIQRLLGGSTRVQASTIHRLARLLLHEAGWLDGKEIADSGESIRMVRHFLQELGADEDDDLAEQLMTEISGMRNRMTNVREYEPQTLKPSIYRGVVQRYADWKRQSGKIDFDDMLVYMYMLLTREPGRFAGRYSHLLIDEFQDTSLLQYDILQRLAKPDRRLYVVGDVDQSIYAWRGAGPEVMLRFPKDYPGCHRVVLSHNYRASETLITCTNRLIQVNQRRTPKVIDHVHAGGESPVALMPADDADEARKVADQLQRWHTQEAISWDEQAVIYRRNYQSLLHISELSTRGIPFRILGEPPNPFVHWVGVDIMAYVRLALGERDPELLVRIINRPSRYIRHDLTRQAAERWMRGVTISRAFELLGATKNQLQALADMEHHLERLASASPYQVIPYIRDEIKYGEHVNDYVKSFRGGSPVVRGEAMAHLTLLDGLAGRFDTLQEFGAFGSEMRHLGRGWWRTAMGAAMSEEVGARRGVTLTTAHSAKGLEFDAVAVVGLSEGVLPAEGEDIEDERRLAYVAMTRARRFLVLSSPKVLLGEARKPSRFVSETLPPCDDADTATGTDIDLSIGDKVEHKSFGVGRVIDLEAATSIASIQFADGTTRRLSLSVCQELGLLKRRTG